MGAFTRLALVGIILSLGMVPLAVMAQAEGESSDLVISQAVEVVFPVAVFFRADLAVSESAVNGVQLQLAQADRTLFDGVVSAEFLAEEGAGDDVTTLYFDWPIPADNAPDLFADIAYEWRILLEGDEALTVRGVFQFQPGPGAWRVGGELPLRLAVVDSALNLRATYQAMLPAYTLFAQHTGLEPELQWLVLPGEFAFCGKITDEDGEPVYVVSPGSMPDLTYPCSEAGAERMLAEQGFSILRRGAPGLLQFQDDVLRALFDVFYGAYWGDQPVPVWFEAGLERYYAVNPNPLMLRQVQEAARAALLYSAEQLRRGPVETDLYDLWSAQSAMLVLYIADRFGAEAPFVLAQEVRATGFDPAFATLTGQGWTAFLLEWERWLFTESAARAAAWTVHQPVTATARPTDRPTLTPSATTPATHTPPPSLTPQPDLATFLPTPTYDPDTRMSATNTPRPPGSLETRPPSTNDAVARRPGGLCGAALLIPGLALVATGYRRKHA